MNLSNSSLLGAKGIATDGAKELSFSNGLQPASDGLPGLSAGLSRALSHLGAARHHGAAAALAPSTSRAFGRKARPASRSSLEPDAFHLLHHLEGAKGIATRRNCVEEKENKKCRPRIIPFIRPFSSLCFTMVLERSNQVIIFVSSRARQGDIDILENPFQSSQRKRVLGKNLVISF